MTRPLPNQLAFRFDEQPADDHPPRYCAGEKHPQWKGDKAANRSKRERAQRLYPLGPCERCAKPATERHHKDGNTGNNARENIAILCRKCHMTVDGRLAAFREMAPTAAIRPPKSCVTCGRQSKPSRRGLCSICYDRIRRRNRKADQNVPEPCRSCGGRVEFLVAMPMASLRRSAPNAGRRHLFLGGRAVEEAGHDDHSGKQS